MSLFNRKSQREVSALEKLVTNKVYVTPERFAALEQLRTEALLAGKVQEAPLEPCAILGINLRASFEEALRKESGYDLLAERVTEAKEDRKKLARLFNKKWLTENQVGVVVLELHFEELASVDKQVFALALLNKLPVVTLVRNWPEVEPLAAAYSGNTWPVLYVSDDPRDLLPVYKWLQEDLPQVRRIRNYVEDDIKKRVQQFADVNATLHFAKRASVALVPFGVMAVNFMGIVRLMANILKAVGMAQDKAANKAIMLLGSQNAALVTAIDSLGDVYQFAIFSTVLADLSSKSLTDAADALDVVDGLMLGSVSVVTGAVSAIGAYISRPQVVKASAEFLAMLQLMYLINPNMRRPEPPPKEPKVKKTKEEKAKKGDSTAQDKVEGDELDKSSISSTSMEGVTSTSTTVSSRGLLFRRTAKAARDEPVVALVG